jgi:acetolactate synthase I/II/III large subunit
MSTEEMKGAKIILESLKKEGVKDIFGYPGGKVLHIYNELYDSDIKHYLVRHEQAAAHAADGYARSTGKVGVCLATSGPGATNLVTGIATANMDSVPMVAFTGQANTDQIGTDSFQEADIIGITMPITKHNFLVKDINDLAGIIKKAFYIASTGRPGPVLIDVPGDITSQRAPFNYPSKVEIASYKPTYKGSVKQIKNAIKIIQESKRPVVLAGGGIVSSEASTELRKFISLTQIPVTTTLMGLGTYPYNDEYSLKMPGMHGSAYSNFAIQEADLLIAVGMRFDDRITGQLSSFAPNAKVIHIDIDPAEIGKCIACYLPIVGDAKEVLRDMNAYLKEEKVAPKTEWLHFIQKLKNDFPLFYRKTVDGINPQYVIEVLSELTKGEAFYTTEVGTHQMWAAQYLDHKHPRHFITSGGLGTMGFGFPAAMGVQVANPNDAVFNIAGDGSFQMNIQELSTVSYYNIPVKNIILNNQWLGMVRQWQELFFEQRYSSTDLEGMQPDFVKVAEAYGVLGLRATKPEEVKAILEQAINHKGPVVLDIRVNRDENVFPMVPYGKAIDKMIGKKGSIE